MKGPIDLESTPRTKRVVILLSAASCLLCGGAVAHAQGGESTGNSVIGATFSSLSSAVTRLQAQVSALQANEHVDRATLSASGAVSAQNRTWIDRVDHPWTGRYVARFSAGAFSAAPTCVASGVATESADPDTLASPALFAPALSCSRATPLAVACQAITLRMNGVDTGISLICVGP